MSLVPEHASKKARPASAPQLSWLPFHIARSLSMGFGPIDQETMISIYRSMRRYMNYLLKLWIEFSFLWWQTTSSGKRFLPCDGKSVVHCMSLYSWNTEAHAIISISELSILPSSTLPLVPPSTASSLPQFLSLSSGWQRMTLLYVIRIPISGDEQITIHEQMPNSRRFVFGSNRLYRSGVLRVDLPFAGFFERSARFLHRSRLNVFVNVANSSNKCLPTFVNKCQIWSNVVKRRPNIHFLITICWQVR